MTEPVDLTAVPASAPETAAPNPPPAVPVETDSVGLERLIFFSDAVFAIAITLLVLDIRLPVDVSSLNDGQLADVLRSLWQKYLAYVISFLVIGSFWAGHHRRFRLIHRYDRRFIWLNLLLLMVVAFIPFPTTVISESSARTATIFYAMVMVIAGLISALTWSYAAHNNRLIDPDLPASVRRHESITRWVMPVVFLFSIAVAWINPGLAKFAWLLIIPGLRLVR